MQLVGRLSKDAVEERKGASPWLQTWRRLARKKVAMGALLVLLFIYLVGILAPYVAPYDPTKQDLSSSQQGPSREHFLGTDRLGRDLLSRIIWGARTAAIVSIAAVSLSTLWGVILGGLSGYAGRWVDTIIMRLGDMLFAFPSLLLVILVAATVKPRVVEGVRQLEQLLGLTGLARSGVVDYFVVFGALSVVAWPGMARLVRGQMLSLKETQFVEAARAMGASTRRILFVHLLPNAASQIVVAVSMALGGAVTSEVVLSWLGVGIQPPNASWGTMIWENAGMLRAHPHLLLVPSAVVGLVILCFNLLGDGLNDALNPRAR